MPALILRWRSPEGNLRPVVPSPAVTRRQFLALIVPLLAVLLGLIATFVIDSRGGFGAPPWDDDFATRVRASMAQEFVWGVYDKGDRKIWEANFNALNAWVKTFDLYAEIVPPWDVAKSKERSSGQYVGIGIRIERPTSRNGPLESVRITGVQPHGPAADANVQIGDLIVGVDGRPVPEICPAGDDAPLQEAIRGLPGETVVLRLRGPDGAERDASVVRAKIDSGSVFGAEILDAKHGIGYLHIEAFQASTAAEFRKRANELLAKGMRSLIIDLRLDGGGLLDQAVDIADALLSEGVIVRQLGRRAEFSETYKAVPGNDLPATLAVAVLVDGRTASASEILASALQDHRRAVIVGERTYGKFLVQVVQEVDTEAGVALFKRTTSIYETPNGHNYARTSRDDPLAGIVPDLFVPSSEADARNLYEIFVNMSYAEWNPDQKPVHEDFVDHQLEAALAVLRGEAYCPPLRPEE